MTRKSLAAALITLLLTSALFATTAFAADSGEVILTIQQVFTATGSPAPPSEAFTYRLTPEQVANPMPSGSGTDGYTVTVTGTVDADIGPLTFTQVGLFIYQLSCTTNEAAGYTIDRQVYTIEVHVMSDLTIIIVYKSNGEKAASLSFEHAYAGATETDKPTATPTVSQPPGDPTKPTHPPKPSDPGKPNDTPYPGKPGDPVYPGKPGPVTGDEAQPGLYAAMIGIAAVTALGSVIYLLAGKRRKKGAQPS